MQIQVAALLLAFTAMPGSAIPPGSASAQTAPAAATTPAPAPPPDGNRTGGEAGTAADAQAQQNFTIINNTGHTVTALNVSAVAEHSWGPNILGGDTIGNGESAEITFDRGETECNFDIKATYDDGDTTDARGVNLCEVATVTLTAH